MKKGMTAPKPRNPVARQLRTARFSKRIVRSRQTYHRKERGTQQASDIG